MAKLSVKAKEDNPLLGIMLMLFAYLCFTCIDISAKWLALIGLPALQLAFMRYFGHFVISSGLIARGGIHISRFGTDHLGLVVFRGLLLAMSTVLNFIAVRYLPLTLTSTILFSAPIMICALSMPLLGEPVGIRRWIAILIGFVGILIAIRPFGESFHWATLLSLSGALCFALYSIITRKLSGVVSTDTMQFYSGLVGSLSLLPFAIYLWQSPETPFQWLLMFMLGFFGWFGHQMLTHAHRFAQASTLTPFGYTFIIYMTIGSIVVFDTVPDIYTVYGAIIIIMVGLFIWMREQKLSREKRIAAYQGQDL